MHRRPLKTVVNIILSLILILSMNVIPSFAAGYTPGTYELTGTMYVRSGPDKSYKSLGALKKGTTIEVSAVKNTKWGQIDYKGKEGYVSLIYSKKVKGQIKKTETHPTPRPTTVPKPTGAPKPTSAPKPTASPRPTTAPSSSGTKYVLTGNLNVRSGPGTQYPSYGYLKKGDSVEVYGIENTKWGQIAYQGKKAYLSLSYAKKDTSVSAPVKSIVPKDTSSVSAEPVKGTLTVENIDSESGTAKIVLSGIPSGRKIEGASLTVSSTSSNAHTYEGTRNADGTYSFSFNYKNHKMSYGIFTMEAKAKEGSSVTKCGSGTFQMKKPKMAATLTYEGTYMKEYDLTQLMGLRNNLVELRASIVNKTTGAVWPEHTFYVDNIYVFNPLPHVQRMYYLDVNFYYYFIGREDQSVHEDVMIKRLDQQARVNRIMIDYYTDPGCMEMIGDRKALKQYMFNYLEIITTITSVLALRSGKEEHIRLRDETWEYLREKDEALYKKMRRRILGRAMNVNRRLPRMIVISAYKAAQRIFNFS